MAKNTGKKRKRKNVRLHRTVRKTIAAIFMIMAVVVAAIPVEQLGTMQAKTTARDNNITKIFDTVVEDIDNNDKMNQALKSVVGDIMDYPGSNTTGTTVQMRINGTSAIYDKEFRVEDRGTSGKVILGYEGSYSPVEIDLTTTRYMKYFIISNV